jgi:hypothetical protein
MKWSTFIVSVLLTLLLLAGPAQLLFSAAALTWNGFASASTFYDPSGGGSDVVSRFTPARSIVVTRIEVQAAMGAQRLVFSPNFQVIACSTTIAFKITDGTTAFTLPLPGATTLVAGNPNPSSADSGPLKVAFPAGAKIVLTVVQGDGPDPITGATACFFNNANITVQYKVVEDED